MRAVGLITEYNPFHNGHLHHLRESLNAADAEVAVAVMSGHFLQRGEPALVDKWVRTEMALAAGVDLVVELPLPWACSSAPDFARGGVAALTALGVDTLCFGSEAGNLAPLQAAAELLLEKEDQLAEQTASLLREGLNYPQARALVLSAATADDDVESVLATPNNILGIEYLKALRQLGSPVEPLTIQRIGAGFYETAVGHGDIASATGIRKMLADGDDIARLLPPAAFQPLRQALATGQRFSAERYATLLLAQIMRDPERLGDCWLVENGIENRLLSIAEQAGSLEDLIAGSKSRQLTRTRVQRMLVAILLGIRKQEAAMLLDVGPRYLHLLGMSRQGARFLAANRKLRSIPLIQNFSRVHTQLKRFYGVDSSEQRHAYQQLNLQLRATKLYSLLLDSCPQGSRQRDFFEPTRVLTGSLPT